MLSARLLFLLLFAILLIGGFVGRPALVAPCPHGSAEVAQLAEVRTARPIDSRLSGPADRAPVGMATACCTPNCCLAHCLAALAEAEAGAPAPPAGRYRPGTIRLAGRLLGDGPWRPPPLALVS